MAQQDQLISAPAGLLAEQKYAQVGSSRVYYEVAGEGEAVILLHGLSGSSRWWRKNILPLAQHFRVYVVDLLGFGRSRGQRFVLAETAGLIEAWMSQIGETCFHLVGHSMGGLVALELAARVPDRIDHLVLVDAAVLPLGRTILGSFLRLFPALFYMPADFAPVLLIDALRAGPLTLLRATYALHRVDITDDLARIAARTLLVWGRHDWLIPPTSGEWLHDMLPGSEWVVLERSGHNPMWDQAEAFNRLVQDFLRAERPGGAPQ